MSRGRRFPRALWHGLGVALAASVFAWTFRDVRFGDVTALVARIGAVSAVLVLLPQLASAVLEAWGWRLSLNGERTGVLSLLRVRLATEGAATCLPAGVVVAESLKLAMLVSSGLSVPSSVSAVAARKYLLLSSQALYILLAVALGWAALDRASARVLGAGGLPLLLLTAGAVLAVTAGAARMLLSQGGVATRLRSALAKAPVPAIRSAVARHSEGFRETDGRLQRLFGLSPHQEARITSWFLAAWVLEAVETWVILRLLGVDIDFVSVMSFEVALSLLRSLVFVVPAGLGVQDAGYVLFLHALGVPHAATVGAAFSLVKRSKELAWSALGFGLLAADFFPARFAARSASRAKREGLAIEPLV